MGINKNKYYKYRKSRKSYGNRFLKITKHVNQN